jgi:acid stress-induced BolA-like protein IbaG/YrbA
MEQKAVEVIQIWTETEGFKRKKKDQLVYEPLPAVIAWPPN